ncbi:Methyltransferase-like protein 25 [Dissostichus eleginoides]|nr:Methyltransferase-like protein 25 [Dissostichus eleginoides]
MAGCQEVTLKCLHGVCGFPLSQYLRQGSWFCGRNARMSACLALERVSLGQGIQMESLFYRAVLHVILRDHYSSFKSEKRVGNVYSKAKSFVDYVHRALLRLELDESKLSDKDIQDYHDTYKPRMGEMHAFNLLKVTLAPCIEGLILLDRLCYLKEQEDLSFSALVQLFDPLLSPRCYAVVGLKN